MSISFVIFLMNRFSVISFIYFISSTLQAQCNDGEIELWDNCYDIDATYELNLSGQGLTGSIPNEISQLSNLMFLDLSNNDLEGNIPQEVVSMETLLGLNLSQNSLSGSIPEDLGNLTNLMAIDLSYNQLGGSLPSSIGNMAGLVECALSHNQFTGELPNELGQLVFLSEFHANDNQFTGIIPEAMCESGISFNNPLNFNIDGNLFCPPYPNCIEPFTGYQDVSECVGVFELFDSLYYAAEVIELDLSNSGLSGGLSPNIGNFTNLVSIDLSQNALSGPIPSEIGDIEGLEYLNLSQNGLTGPIPTEIGNLSNLKELKLYVNSLSGFLPSSIGNLSSLEYFNVFNNQITGGLPAELANITGLTKLYVHKNQLYGNIPDEIFDLTSLIHLYLNDNDFTGVIPSIIGNLQSLERLRLQSNNLYGYLPDEMCSMNLDWENQSDFNISDNNFCLELPYCVDGNQGDQNTSNCENVNIDTAYNPYQYEINKAYPNPFNPLITIIYSLPDNVLIEGSIFDISGKRVSTLFYERQSPGKKMVKWDGRNEDGRIMSTGIYYFRLSSGSQSKTKKLLMVK